MPKTAMQTNRKRYTLRLTTDELTRINESADEAGITTSEYMRRSALGTRIVPKHNLKAMS